MTSTTSTPVAPGNDAPITPAVPADTTSAALPSQTNPPDSPTLPNQNSNATGGDGSAGGNDGGIAAVIYCPAMNESDPVKTIDGAAQRLARTLDHHSLPIGTVYQVRAAASETYGAEGRTEVREIVQVAPGANPATQGVVTHRVYALDYLSLLDDDTPASNVLLRAVKLLWACAKMGVRFAIACGIAESLSKKQKLSVVFGGLALAGVVLYTLLAIGAAVRIAVDAWPSAPAPVAQQAQNTTASAEQKAPSTPASGTAQVPTITAAPAQPAAGDKVVANASVSWPRKVWHAVKIAWSAVKHGVVKVAKVIWDIVGSATVKFVAVIGALGLSVAGLRAWFDRNVTATLRFCRYLDEGPARASCVGKFNALLEHVLNGAPTRTDVVSYSLGSLVALDALYPPKGCPNVRVGNVNTLTTIGCPFDFVRTFWGDYFEGRAASCDSLVWWNVFSPVDLLGSNFSNADGLKPHGRRGINRSSRSESDEPNATTAPQGVAPAVAAPGNVACPKENLFYDPLGRQDLSIWHTLIFEPFAVHAQYWVPEHLDAESCFECFVPKLYEKC